MDNVFQRPFSITLVQFGEWYLLCSPPDETQWTRIFKTETYASTKIKVCTSTGCTIAISQICPWLSPEIGGPEIKKALSKTHKNSSIELCEGLRKLKKKKIFGILLEGVTQREKSITLMLYC